MHRPSAPLPVTLLVMTFNEEAAIGRCLDSVDFAAEKIVIDSGSTDRTVLIAAEHGARVVHQEWLGYGAQRVFATGLAAHDWILFLDADEWLSPELADSMRGRLPELLASSAAAASFERHTMFLGEPMRWYRPLAAQKVTRLYHRARARWSAARVHEAMQVDGPMIPLRGALLEDGVPTLLHRQLKDLAYAELKVRDWLERGARGKSIWLWPLVFIATFFKDYFLRLAVLDGWRGAAAAYLAAHYAVYKRLRLHDARLHPQSLPSADAALARLKRSG